MKEPKYSIGSVVETDGQFYARVVGINLYWDADPNKATVRYDLKSGDRMVLPYYEDQIVRELAKPSASDQREETT